MKIEKYAAQSGRIIGEDGKIHNIVTLLGGGNPVSTQIHDINKYAPQSGRVIGEDGRVYNLVDLLRNVGGGEDGVSGPVNWSEVKNKPASYPPSEHNHDGRYYTKSDIDNAGYLLAQPDGETVEIQGGELRARALTGLQLGVAQLNAWLAGTEGNIQGQLNDITMTLAALSAGMRYLGKFETKADLDSVANKDNGDLAVVLVDETRSDARSMYVYNDSLGLWDFIGAFEFADSFTALSDTPNSYDDEKYLRSGLNGLYFDVIRYNDLEGKPNSTIAQIDNAVDKTHEHSNADSLNRIGIDGQGRITIDGVPYVPAYEVPQKEYLYARRTGTGQTLEAGNAFIFNSKLSGDIPYNTSTGVFTLKAGKRYKVTVTASINTTGYVTVSVVNAATNTAPQTNLAIWTDLTANWHEASAGPLIAVIVPTVDTEYKIRAMSVNGTTELRSSHSALIVEEI